MGNAATEAFGILGDALSEYAGKNGYPALQGIFQWAGNASSTFGVYLEENPVQAAAAMTAGLLAVAALGPEATTATAISYWAGVLETRLAFLGITSTAAESIATAAINGLIAGGTESAYNAATTELNAIFTALGGALNSITVPNGINVLTSTASTNPNLIVTSAPDSSGNTPELLINLPVPTQDSSSVSVVSSSTSAMAPGAPAYQTDEFTGSTITFTGSDGQTHTGTILYAGSSGLGYFVDNVSGVAPGSPYAGVVFVGNSLVQSITTPQSYTFNVESSQLTSNPDGSQTTNTDGIANGSVQYTETDNTSSSGAVSSSITGTGDTATLSDASISLASDATSTVAGNADSIAAAAGAAVTLAADASGDTVTANGTGVTVNVAGAIGTGTITKAGSVENVGYEGTIGVDSNGDVVTVTGTDGTETLNSGTSGSTIGNMVNWNDNSSETQSYSVSGSTSTQVDTGYTGTNGTGTQLFQQTLTDASGTITDDISGSGYYNPITGTTWNGIAQNILGNMLNGPQLQALDIAAGEGGGIAVGTPVYLPISSVSVGSTPVSMSSSGTGLNGDTYAYIEQTGKLYSVGANPNGSNLETAYALTTNGTSLADTQPGSTTVSYSSSNGGTVTLASATGGGQTDTMTLTQSGNDDSFALGGSMTVTFAPGAITSLTDDDETFAFGNASGAMGTVGYDTATSIISEAINSASMSVIANSILAASGSGDTIHLGSGDTLDFGGDTSDTIDPSQGGTITVSSTGTVSFDIGTAIDALADVVTSFVDSSTPWFNLASGGSDQLQLNPFGGVTSIFASFTGADGTGTLNQYIENLTGGTSLVSLETSLPSGEEQVVDAYAGTNATGALTSTTTNMTAGNSTIELFNPNGFTATDIQNWTGSNGTGSDTGNMLEFNDGSSQSQTFSSLPSGVDQLDTDYSGADGTGTVTSTIDDWTAGGSQQQITVGLPSGESEVLNNYAGADQTGGETTSITDYDAGNSQLEEFNVGGNISTVFAQFSGLNATGTDEQNTLNFTNGSSQSENMTGLPSGTIETITGYSGANLAGTENYNITDYSNDNSTMELLNPSSGVNNVYEFFGDLNAVGTPNDGIVYNANNTSIDVTYNWNGNSGITYDTFYNGGQYLGYGIYSSTGQYGGGTFNGESNGSFGSDDGFLVEGSGINLNDDGSGYDAGYELTASTTPKPAPTDITKANVAQGNPAAEAAAQMAQNEISLVTQLAKTDPSSISQPFYEGSKWNGTVITWSLANSAGPSGSSFSSYMGKQYEALVTAAFAEWGKASGITFQEVSDSAQSDIRLGFGDFNTAASGVTGYTSFQYQDGQIEPDAIIRIEDPSVTSLAGTGAASTYAGTQANLYQVILHEIGHALGLADNADPNSVMYYQASDNIKLDSTDTAGIQAMYGPNATLSFALPVSEATLASQIQQLTQATSTFQSQQSAAVSFVPAEITVAPTALATPQAA